MDDLERLALAAGNTGAAASLDSRPIIYVFHQGAQWGPYSQANIYTWVVEGRIGPDAHGRLDGGDWLPIGHFVPLPAQAPLPNDPKDTAGQTFAHGPRNPAMVCPHCHAMGMVRTQVVKRGAGISGGKAAAALLTGGASMLATGLSRKETVTQARCDHCGNAWVF